MISIILMVVTTVLTAIATGFLNNKFGINIQGFSLFIIFPIGACLIGGLSASGGFIGQKITKQPIKKHLIALAMLIGAASFFAATFVDYKMVLTEVEDKLSEQLKSASQDEKDAFYKEVSYFNYLKEIHDNSTITLSVRSKKGVKIDNSIVSKISFWLSVAGGVLGGWFAASMAIGERTKDKKTGEYRDLKYMALMSDERFAEFEEAVKDKNFVQQIAKIMIDNPNDKSLSSSNRVLFKVLKTRSTGEGQVVINKYVQVGKNSNLDKTIEKDLTPEQISELMNAVFSIDSKEKF